jgi:hypothetical protein
VSKTVLKLLASELALISVTCPNKECGATLEMSLKRMPQTFDGFTCPVCQKEVIPAGADRAADHLRSFAKAVQGMVALHDKVSIKIIVPIKQD